MNIKSELEKSLRDYKKKKSVVETTLLRIKTYEETIQDPDSFSAVLLGTSREPGMPRGDGGGGSSVELAVTDKEKAIELLKEWINDDKSRIYPYQVEIEQIDAALLALTMQERFIIECKYFEGMIWRDIEININNKFRQRNYITDEGLRKINKQALELLTKILEPYYRRFNAKS